MTRNEAIKEAGIETVEAVDIESVDFTNRVTDGTVDQGYVEFSASVDFSKNDDDCSLIVYVLVDEDEVAEAGDDLGNVDWDRAFKSARYEII